MTILQACNICKGFGTGSRRLMALEDVSLSIGRGERVGLIGESGSGKSTLAGILAGLDRADAGMLEVDGVRWDASKPARKRSAEERRALMKMQMVFQHPASTFSDRMTLGQGIIEGIAYRPDFDRSMAEKRMRETLELVALPTSYADKHAWSVSGGECQRAAIARAIISRPQLLICDEPTSALDVTVQAQIMELLDSLCNEMGMACLFITHNLALAQGFCSEVHVMRKGRIIERGTVDQVFASPQQDYTRQLISSVISM